MLIGYQLVSVNANRISAPTRVPETTVRDALIDCMLHFDVAQMWNFQPWVHIFRAAWVLIETYWHQLWTAAISLGSIADVNYFDQKCTLLHFATTLIITLLVLIMQICWVDIGQKRLCFTAVLFLSRFNIIFWTLSWCKQKKVIKCWFLEFQGDLRSQRLRRIILFYIHRKDGTFFCIITLVSSRYVQ